MSVSRSHPPSPAAPRYFYRVSFEAFDRSIALAEAAEWLDEPVVDDFHFSANLRDIAPCAYLALCGEVLARAPRFDDLVDQVRALQLPDEGYLIDSAKTGDAQFETSVKKLGSMGIARALADAMQGMPNLDSPRDRLWAWRLPDEWVFIREQGRYTQAWMTHHEKPYTFSSALKPRLAQALVNLAAPARLQPKTFLDPCCGAGTTLIEAAHRGLTCLGVDIGIKIAHASRGNLKHYSFSVPVLTGDAANLADILAEHNAAGDQAPLPTRFDAAVIDFPYGHFSPAEEGLYDRLLSALHPYLTRVAIVTAKPAEALLTGHGYQVLRTATAKKSRLTRHITLAVTADSHDLSPGA